MTTKLKDRARDWRFLARIGAVAAGVAFLGFTALGAKAADLGGNCCADLEERIAELEATTARKGNRKVSVTISGQVSEALVDVYGGGLPTHTQVQSNSNRDAQSVIRINGAALIQPGWSAGFLLEVGTGGFAQGVITTPSNGLDTNQLYVRQQMVYIKSDQFGGLSIGKQELATFNVTGAHEGNTGVAHTMLGFEPLTGPTLGSALDIWDGGITTAIKYKSPRFFQSSKGDGVWVEAAWANADDFSSGATNPANGDLWDVAVKGLKQFDQVEVSGALGYRNGMVVDLTSTGIGGFFSGLNVQDIKVWSAGVGVKHLPTGVFVNASYGDWDASTLITGLPHLKAWEVQAGVEEKWSHLGKTTLFAQYARYDLGSSLLGSSNASFGGGVVQNIEAAATDVYLSVQDYQPDAQAKSVTGLTGDVKVLMGGVTVRF